MRLVANKPQETVDGWTPRAVIEEKINEMNYQFSDISGDALFETENEAKEWMIRALGIHAQ